jgi:hypothetical protein
VLTFDPIRHRYEWEGVQVPSMTQLIDSFIDAPPYPGGNYAERGTAVHAVTAAYDRGELDVDRWREYDRSLPEADRVEANVDAWIDFRAFYGDRLQFVLIEEMLYSPRLRVAGTLDRYCLIDGEPWILDLKNTEGEPPRKSVAMQTAGYGLLANHAMNLSLPSKRLALALRRDRSWKPYYYDSDADYLAISDAARLWWYLNR